MNGHLPFPTASLTLQAFKSGLKCTQMSLGFLCFSLSNHLNALPAQINLLWHYSGFKNLSTSHGFNFARAVEERVQAGLPGRAAPTAALAHSLTATESSSAAAASPGPHHPQPHSSTASLSAFPYKRAKNSSLEEFRCEPDGFPDLTVFSLQHMYESP